MARRVGARQMPRALALAPRGDAAFARRADRASRALAIAQPASRRSRSRRLFGRVWYEDYPEPAFVWQSTGGTDEFEPKLSLVAALRSARSKGTFYALFFAIPLGVLGAIYTSQFMHPRLQRWVKPAVEIMASLPSVVLGFLAGLWLAPRLERLLPGLLLAGRRGPRCWRSRRAQRFARPARAAARSACRRAAEVALAAAALALGAALSLRALGRRSSALLFGGDFSALAARAARAWPTTSATRSWSASRWPSR